jgi:competence protein ComEC
VITFKFSKLVLLTLITCIIFTSCGVQNPSIQDLKVHFIDVGQGDSILIQTGTKTMLIDTGLKKNSDEYMKYLDSLGLKKIDYLILTHQHNDHIGNAAKVIKNYNIEMLYMPDVTSTDKEFESTIKAINKYGIKITRPAPGSSFDMGEAKFTIFAPNRAKYEDDNNYSIVLKMVYKNTSFLFTGDALFLSEKEMINKGFDLSSDVLKIAHHGSDDSTSEEFLNKVNPKFTVLSCEKNDSVDHPSKETMKLLKNRDIPVYRTDESGTIVCTSDGQNIVFDKEQGNYKHGKK